MPPVLRALSLVHFLAAPVAAQAVEGIALAGGRPVGYAVVLLVDSAGREVGVALSDSGGRFAVRAAVPGSHRVAVRRIGQRPWLSEPLVLGDAVQPLALDLPEQPVVLPALQPEATGRCRTRPALGAATTALLDAARTGLGVAEATTRLGSVQVRAVVRARLLDRALMLQTEQRTSLTGRVDWPFATLPVDSAAAIGFVGPAGDGAPGHYGPDASLFGADWFLDTHCFDLVLPEPPGDNLVGLTFQPRASSSRADLRGTLWLDRGTLHLLRLEFRWTGLDAWVPREAAGGDLEFLPLPGGGVLLHRWWVRVPLVDDFGLEPRLVGFLEGGGEVTEVLEAAPAP